MNHRIGAAALALLFASTIVVVSADEPDTKKKVPTKKKQDKGFPQFGPGGPGGFGGPGMGQIRKLVKQFDKNGDGWLNKEERKVAREFLKKERAGGGGGFRPGGFGPPGGFTPGAFLARPLLEALDADEDGQISKDELVAGVKKFFKASDKDKNGSLNEKQIAAGIADLMPRPPGFPGVPGGFPGGGMRGFGPGNDLAGAILKRADADKDKKVTLKELLSAAEKLFKEADKDKNGKLDERELGAAIASLIPARRGFSPGAFWVKPLQDGLDADEDGKLTKEKIVAGVTKLFKASDKDKKGSLNEKQLAAAINGLLPALPGFPGGGPGRFGPGQGIATAILKRADADKDGKVTLKEMLAALEKLFKESDKDKDGKLDEKELAGAIALVMPAQGGFGRPGRGFGPPGGRENREPAKPGPRVKVEEATSYPKASLYEPTVLRTVFLEFEDKDWEAEMADFYHTDVEVPATLIVDGKKYPKVGVRFRGMSSYFAVSAGYKRSMNVTVDLVDKKQRVYGYKTLNLLNSHDDPGFMSTVLYSHIARKHIPTPKANFVKVVVNGESWGVYVNAQQFNKEFIAENFKSAKGARWKVQGSPGGGGGLEYFGDKIDDYKNRVYRIKSRDRDKSWQALAHLCKTLNKTPLDKLEEALKPILDIDGALWFLAIDNALINNDGYWVRASDYSIFQDSTGKFHFIPHDMNEAFTAASGFGFGGPGRGPGGPRGPGGGPGAGGDRPSGVALDPLIGLDDARKPLRSRLLAVPKLKARYLEFVRTIAEKDLDWKNLGPVVKQFRTLIDKEVKADTRKIYAYDAFQKATADSVDAEPPKGRQQEMSLRSFADQRRKYLLKYKEPKKDD
jgi:Ca2+-binding EF-hand superfamily protein